jgi:hypothetical protein
MIISYNELLNAIGQWANNKANDFQYYWPLKGGWESWAQAEIAAFILNADSTSDIEREQHVYTNNSLSTDILVNANITANQQQILVVEMKCESLYQQIRDRNAFLNGIDADILKLHRNNLKPNFQNAQRCVLGIYFDNAARNGLMQRGFFEFFENGEVGCAVKLLL